MAHNDEWENENDENQDNLNDDINEADDSFGLPDVSYEPLDEGEQSEESGYDYAAQESSYETSDEYGESEYSEGGEYEEEEYEPGSYEPKYKESKTPLVITFIVLFLIVGGVLGYFFYWKPQQEKATKFDKLMTQADKHIKDKKWDAAIALFKEARKIKPGDPSLNSKMSNAKSEKQKEEDAKEAELEEIRAAEEAAAAAELEEQEQEPGTVETISSRTGRYYVVVASAVDGDLANDFAQKLAQEGSSPKVIEPYNSKKRFFRVALADFESLTDAEGKADELKGEYGDEVWVMRY